MTRTLLLAVAAALILVPGMALAQAVPPAKRPFVGPPKPEEDPGGLPPGIRDVSQPIGTGSAVAGTVADTAKAGANLNAKITKNMSGVAPYIGGTAEGAKESIKASKDLAKTAKVVGKVATGLELAADATSAAVSCSNGDTANCTLDSLDVVSDLVGMAPGPGKAISASYTVGKVVGKAVSASYEKKFGVSIGEDLYDMKNANREADAIVNAGSPSEIQAHRAKLRARHKESKANLEAKQQADDAAEQARQADLARQAQMRANQAAYNQAFSSNLVNALQPLTQGGVPQTKPCAFWQPCAGGIHTQAQYDALVAKASARQATGTPLSCSTNPNLPNCSLPDQGRLRAPQLASPPPPSSSGGCGLTAEDRAKGRVCTAN